LISNVTAWQPLTQRSGEAAWRFRREQIESIGMMNERPL
jgi:hypothetical protein